MFRNVTRFFLISLFFVLSSCGYKFGHGGISEKYATITIPFVDGDKSGLLTAELVKQISHLGVLEYRNSRAELELKVVLLDTHSENIGYQYYRDVNNNVVDRLAPTEGRSKVLAEVSIVESLTGKTLLGPKEIVASVDYDFDPDLSVSNVTEFSIGQLSANDSAQDVAKITTNQVLSEKIINFILNSWE